MLKFLVLGLLALNILVLPPVRAHGSAPQESTLIFAGNMPEIVNTEHGNYGNLAGLLQRVRQQQNHTLFVFSGGSLGPSQMSSFDYGSHIIDILNSLEPDLMTVGKREFSFTEDELSLRSHEAAFPIVASNLYDPLVKTNLEGLYDSILITKGQKKIGFICIVASDVIQEYLLPRVTVLEPRRVIERLSTQLRQQGADMIVLLYSEQQDYYTQLLDNSQIDLAFRTTTISDTANTDTAIQHPKIFALSEHGRALQVNIQWPQSPKAALVVTSKELLLRDYPQDPGVGHQVRQYSARMGRLLNHRIGSLGINANTLRGSVRTEENAFANFIADAIRSATKTDIALINGGAIRGNKAYLANSIITRQIIRQELPFRSRLAILSLTGEQLSEALEHSVSAAETMEGRFAQVSGLTFSFSLSAAPGKRVTNIKIKDQALDPSATYTMGTSDYLAKGGDGYLVFLNAKPVGTLTSTQPLISDIVINTIQRQQNINPSLDARIVRLD
jgi:2',3'-cyclic-nucleotide 2'-phosphodiesterase (5'-nucleotidase family)